MSPYWISPRSSGGGKGGGSDVGGGGAAIVGGVSGKSAVADRAARRASHVSGSSEGRGTSAFVAVCITTPFTKGFALGMSTPCSKGFALGMTTPFTKGFALAGTITALAIHCMHT